MFGTGNGDLVNFLDSKGLTLVTFDKDFLDSNMSVKHGVVIIDVHPNEDAVTVPILESFLNELVRESVLVEGRKILLNNEFLSKIKR